MFLIKLQVLKLLLIVVVIITKFGLMKKSLMRRNKI